MKEPVYGSLTNMHAFSSYFLPFDKEQCILSMTKLNSTSCALAIRPSYIQNADLKKKKTFQNPPDQSTNEDQSFKNSA